MADQTRLQPRSQDRPDLEPLLFPNHPLLLSQQQDVFTPDTPSTPITTSNRRDTRTIDERNIHLISGSLDRHVSLGSEDPLMAEPNGMMGTATTRPATPPTTTTTPTGTSGTGRRSSSRYRPRRGSSMKPISVSSTLPASQHAPTELDSHAVTSSSPWIQHFTDEPDTITSLLDGANHVHSPTTMSGFNSSTNAGYSAGPGGYRLKGSHHVSSSVPHSASAHTSHHTIGRRSHGRSSSINYGVDLDSEGEIPYAGSPPSGPSSRRTSIQLHFQEPRSRRSSLVQHAPSPILASAGVTGRRKTSGSNPTLSRTFSRSSVPSVSRKPSINFVNPPPIGPGAGGSIRSTTGRNPRSRRNSVYDDEKEQWAWDIHASGRRSLNEPGQGQGSSSRGRVYTVTDRYPDRAEEEGSDLLDEESDGAFLGTDEERGEGDYQPQQPKSSRRSNGRSRNRSKSTSFAISTVKKSDQARQGSSIRRNVLIAIFVVLGLFLLGTVLVLSTVQSYFSIPDWAYLTDLELGGWNEKTIGRIPEFQMEGPAPTDAEGLGGDVDEGYEDEDGVAWGHQGKGTGKYWMRKDWDGRVRETEWTRLDNVTNLPGEKIPRLIHQTWKSDVLPEKWRNVWRACREGMPDYEYMLWTDDMSRRFIAEEYPSFLPTFDGYEFPIQRADAIRYFVLHHYGGIYMDLDIGCKRRLDPLLQGDWDVVLPRTKPVGVSNDLIFSSKRNAFMDATIHGLIAFNHKYVTNYPTVMFSTGPMFLSAQYGLYSSAHPLTPAAPRAEVRILPKSLYGKNAKPGEAPHSFFSHFYGSSWHSDDAGFIVFLGDSGKKLLYVGIAIFIAGGLRFLCSNNRAARSGRRSLRRFVMASTGYRHYHMVSILPTSESADGSRTTSPAPSSADTFDSEGEDTSRIIEMMKAIPSMLLPSRGSKRNRNRNERSEGVLFYLPTMFASSDSNDRRNHASSSGAGTTASGTHRYPPAQQVHGKDYAGTLRSEIVPEQTEDEDEQSAAPTSSILKTFDWMARSPGPPPYDTLGPHANGQEGEKE